MPDRDTAWLVGRVAGWTVLLLAVLRYPWVVAHATVPFTAMQEAVALWYGGRGAAPIAVTLECSATDVMALCAGVVLAYPTSWTRRLVGVAVILPALLVVNIIRIATLERAAGSAAFEFLHEYLWPAALIAIALGLVLLWLRSIGKPIHLRDCRGWVSLYCLGGFALAAPWLASGRMVASGCALVAASASFVMRGLGAGASVSGPVLTTTRGAFVVTSDCLLSPIIPLWVAAVFWWRLSRLQRVIALALTLPLIVAAATARLLVLALPVGWVSSPLIFVHGFYQLVLFVAVVTATALYTAARPESRSLTVIRRAVLAVVLVGGCALVLGRLYNAILVAVVGEIVPLAPHALRTLLPSGDLQGALVLLPAYQIALFAAMVVAFGRPFGRLRVLAGFAVLAVSQIALLVFLGELTARTGVTPHPLVLRGWAAALPMVLAWLVIDRTAPAS